MAISSHDFSHHETHSAQIASKVIFGFWIYIMTDAIMFATLFAVYAVLHNNTFGGPGIRDVATLHHVLMQTIVLLVSVFTFGLSLVSFYRGRRGNVGFWMVATFILGLIFLGIEWNDGAALVHQGYSWTNSAFLSSYFTFLGIHGLHIFIALLWMVVLFIQFKFQGFSVMMRTRLICLSLFWNFLNLMWIVAFMVMFLMGAV